MRFKVMQRPHIVTFRWDFETWPETEVWVRSNIKGAYQLLGLQRHSVMFEGRGSDSRMFEVNADENDNNVVAMFESADDAMMFKLRWVGQDG